MVQISPEFTLAIGGAAVAIVVWLVRLEGRVNTNEALQKSVFRELQYIRSRLDQFLGGGGDNE